MNRQLTERLDEYRKPRFRSRSNVVQEALLRFLDQEEKQHLSFIGFINY